jgi:tetratricopeptide (TPR) repeat protein
MTHRALLLGLLIALSARVAQAAPEIIDESLLEPRFKDFRARFEQVKKQTLPITEFVGYYQQQAQAKGTPRDQAIAAFFYGFVLYHVVPQSKESKDAKREFRRAIDLEPGFVLAYAELASIAYDAGDRREAERLLQSALQVSPTFVRAVVQLAQMAQRAGEVERAKALYEQSVEIEPTLQAFGGLVIINTTLFQRSYDEKEKEKLARAALAASDAVVTLQPENPALRLAKAEVLLNLGRVKEAIDFLEGLYAGGTLKPEVQADLLKLLRGIHQSQGNVEGVKHAIDRLLKCEALRPEERARIASRAKDLQELGRYAFIQWGIEDAISILHNPGLSVEQRLSVLRRLQEFIGPDSEAPDVPELQPLVLEAWRECFRILVDGPPELVIAQLRALRSGRAPPRLMTVLVHFVYPNGKTEEVREEGVRTIAACAGTAAVPSIYFSLQDASGRVVREADSQLSVLCERRSPLGGGIEPFTPEQRQQALRAWTAYFRSADGAERLAKAFKDLSGSVLRVEPDRTSAPMIDHAAHVLLDGDIPWAGWAAAYDFLVQYWGKDFRPVERRGKPVEPSEREAIVKAFESEYAAEEPQPPPARSQPVPAGSAGMAKGK